MKMVDVSFHSEALGRDMPYRVLLPDPFPAGQKLPAVYLLHGKGDTFRSWSNNSDVSQFAAKGLILVCVEGSDSWYINADSGRDRYQDYILQDVMADVERRFPARADRGGRALIGNSMGGYGAVTLALQHPERFAFVGTLGAAFDVPRRSFSWRRFGAWYRARQIFGPAGSATRRKNDPFLLARDAEPGSLPYLYLVCGDQDPLVSANRAMDRELSVRHIRHEFHSVPGGHDWTVWNTHLQDIFAALVEHIG